MAGVERRRSDDHSRHARRFSVSLYLDANIVVPLLRLEPHSAPIERWLGKQKVTLAISDFGAAEVSAVVSRDVRMGMIDATRAKEILADFDDWRLNDVQMISIGPRDVSRAEAIVRDFDTKLAVPDALHLAIVMNAGLTLVTLDQRLAEAARTKGVPLAMPS
jgi:uncharacterized protein